jgi:hypothetical protein
MGIDDKITFPTALAGKVIEVCGSHPHAIEHKVFQQGPQIPAERRSGGKILLQPGFKKIPSRIGECLWLYFKQARYRTGLKAEGH